MSSSPSLPLGVHLLGKLDELEKVGWNSTDIWQGLVSCFFRFGVSTAAAQGKGKQNVVGFASSVFHAELSYSFHNVYSIFADLSEIYIVNKSIIVCRQSCYKKTFPFYVGKKGGVADLNRFPLAIGKYMCVELPCL